MILDTLETTKVTFAGMSAFWIGITDIVPEFISMCVGCATLVYLIIKIVKELKSF
tara:strand:+ start:3801 stop:3965 length:165 start_codon:yes stop_codon:yes gene_type:complete